MRIEYEFTPADNDNETGIHPIKSIPGLAVSLGGSYLGGAGMTYGLQTFNYGVENGEEVEVIWGAISTLSGVLTTVVGIGYSGVFGGGLVSNFISHPTGRTIARFGGHILGIGAMGAGIANYDEFNEFVDNM